MSEFKREERYLVLKLKDLSPAAEEHIRQYVAARNLPNRQCVVVESDWPEYELVWTMIEARVAGRPSAMEILAAEAQALREEVAALRARVAVVPDGYALVPIEPNDEMLSAGCVADNAMHSNLSNRDNKHRCYQSMLNAAPRLNGLTVSEGLLRRLCEPLLSHADYVVARNELRALLGEEKEHE
ncbi:hypothetical protein AAA503_20375 [Pseudomonas aeruginosa]|uniref:hypothetical protein n=1 Tax=Pseudomonas aeruginosa TaxID=287 RepID=UPI00071B63AD|nr:hypothetical protein [Pseudomonas aeruginosa]KSL05501.1 hypothetical protein APA48_29085 [Pseudomonas aeruginosa]OVZ01934.1 hypothetical protein CDO39_17060 [Pseudomonas aeruginosa]PTZ38518.1 hypothetical protein DB381_32650 [Pseudomonas aeruginosa]